jgi:hypothetical protein
MNVWEANDSCPNHSSLSHCDKKIACSREALKEVINDTTAKPAELDVKYINEFTDFSSKKLGEGAFGEVFFGTDPELRLQFAVKRTRTTQVPTEEDLKAIITSFKKEISVSCICQCV